MYIPKRFISGLQAIDFLMERTNPDLFKKKYAFEDGRLEAQRPRQTSNAPAPIGSIYSRHSLPSAAQVEFKNTLETPEEVRDFIRRREEDRVKINAFFEEKDRYFSQRGAIICKLREALAESELTATMLSPTGGEIVLSDYYWRTEKSLELLKRGQAAFGGLMVGTVIILREAFLAWCQVKELADSQTAVLPQLSGPFAASSSPGVVPQPKRVPHSGRNYETDDQALVAEALAGIKDGKFNHPWGAAQSLAPKAVGGGTEESKAKRILRKIMASK